MASTIGPSVNPLHKYNVNSTYEHYYEGLYSIFDDPNMKEILLELHGKHVVSKCEHIIELNFSPKPNFSNLFEISVTKVIQNSISHAP